MKYAIEHYVGRKYGTWARGTVRFETSALARRDADDLTAGAKQANATLPTMRIVEVTA